jgi:transposase InsO family protein
LIECFGISKQAFYKRLKAHTYKEQQEQLLFQMVQECRKQISQQTGGRKLYSLLQAQMQQQNMHIGRDKFFRFLRAYNLLVPKTKRHFVTTNSKHHFYKYKNLIKDKAPTRPEQLWVSDITYIKTEKGHSFLALVTDAYSKQIMGYKLASHMRTSLCTDALAMAIKNRKYPKEKLIHHSDRGIQYCNPAYTSFAEQNNITLSMTQQYDPYENAVAERINRTLKYEFGLKQTIKNVTLAKKMIKRAVVIYNTKRPHLSLKFNTPNCVHHNQGIDYHSYIMNQEKLELLTF